MGKIQSINGAKENAVCSYCHKPNHWVAVCRKRAVNTVDIEPDQDFSEEQILNINLTQDEKSRDDKWTVNLDILSQEVLFRIDTGAKCNTLTLDRYQLLMHEGELKHSNIVLR